MGVPKRRRYRTSAAAFVSGITLAAPIMRAMRRYDIVTFDCYGTLIDWESGIAKAFRDAGLANVDDDLLGATRRLFRVDFDLVVTAQQVRSYKPRHAHFLAARAAIGDVPWLHAVASNFHDIVPTKALRIENAWINRRGAPQLAGGVPTLGEFRDLAALAGAIA